MICVFMVLVFWPTELPCAERSWSFSISVCWLEWQLRRSCFSYSASVIFYLSQPACENYHLFGLKIVWGVSYFGQNEWINFTLLMFVLVLLSFFIFISHFSYRFLSPFDQIMHVQCHPFFQELLLYQSGNFTYLGAHELGVCLSD